ncbi:MAG TPA: lysine--tRNA ligase [Thermoprotei archaeon]|nr:lysine--tRNA ligase [Thermoprotei archaeon]
MTTEDIIGRGTWIDKVAHEIVNREKKLGRNLENIYTESGLGASGIPHVGSMADAVRAYTVALALEDMGYNSKLIAFSDDMDGLRKVPSGFPSWMNEWLLKPVSEIPDPDGCHESYGRHMSSMLEDALDKAGIEYIHKSGYEMYKSGVLSREIHEILLNWRRVGEIIYEETGQDKYLYRLPYHAKCKECGRIYTTEAIEYDTKNRRVLYRCIGDEIGGTFHRGCGYEGYAYIDRADGKLAWKSEFAARWRRLDIRFEAYGKDIADSVRVNDIIAREVLGYEPPYHVRYELFLDASGKKIAKSKGNVFTPQIWYRYGNPESLILYLLKRFSGTRKVKLDTIVTMMRELDYHRQVYHGKIYIENPMKKAKIKGLIEYVYKLRGVPPVKVPYEIVLSLAEVAPEGNEREFIIKRLDKYGYKSIDDEVENLINYAINWVRDYGKPPIPTGEINIDIDIKEALKTLNQRIHSNMEGEEIQGLIFNVAREYGISYRKIFQTLYQIIIGTPKGPRLGPLIKDIGVEKVKERINKYL